MPLSSDLHNSTISIEDSDRRWFDSHCHFDFDVFDHDRAAHWQRLTKFGCAGLIIPGVAVSQWSRLISLCTDKPWGML
jgi:TatD DNase family protein